jgi:hypothetical protein
MNNFVPLITNNIPIVNDPEQLKNFGEFMKQFLDPFGIDVDYYVSRASEGAEKKPEEAAKKSQEEAKPSASAAAATAATATVEKADLLTGSKIEEKSQDQMQAEASSVLSPESAYIPSAPSTSQTSIESDLEPFRMAANALKSKIDENGKKEDSRKSEDEDNGFNLVDIEKELKYISSIEQLKAMGYNDEGGWLTRLVIAKNGSINAVLDALNPSHK